MKRLLLLLSFLISAVICFAQYPIPQKLGNDSTIVGVPGALKSRLINKRFDDTTAANLERIKYYDGAQIYTNNGGGARFWLRDSTFNKWTEIVSGGASSIITIITDSSINICSFVDNAASVCDTFVTNNINAIASVEIINDSTLLVCDIEALCDTLHIPQTNFFGISANNGLTMSAPTNVQLGGQLVQNTTVNTRFQILTIAGKTIYDYPLRVQQDANFANSTAMQSWKSIGGISTEIDFNNAVRLGVNYTGAVYPVTPTNYSGYMGDRIGYWIGQNATGNGSFGLRTDNASSKIGGIFFHTLDTSYTDAITFFGKHPPNANYQAAPGVGSTGLQPYRSLTLHDNNKATFFGRMEEAMGANVAAANDLTIGLDGNLFTITGNTQVNAIATGNWQAGSEIAFIFTGTPILKNNTAGGAGTATMLLAGRIDFQAAAGDYIGFRYDGTNWYEINRKLAGTVSAGLSTADNGLTANTATNVQLGGTLTKNTTIANASSFFLRVNGDRNGSILIAANTNVNSSAFALQAQGTGTASGTNGISSFGGGINASATGIAVRGSTTDGIGIYGAGGNTGVSGFFESAFGPGIIARSISDYAGSFVKRSSSGQVATVETGINITKTLTSGTPAIGMGVTADFILMSASSTDRTANQLISKWTTATDASRTSQFILTGVNNAVTANLLTISGSGATALNKYGVGSFTAGTPAYAAAWDASGNFMETTVSASGLVYTASNGLTMTANNVVLGGTLTGNTTITLGSNDLTFTGSAGAEITYTADTHIFTGAMRFAALAGSGAGIVAVDNSGNLSWAATGGGGGGGTLTSVAAGYGTTFTTITTTGSIVIDSTKFPDKTRPNVVSGAWNFTAMPVIGALAGSGAGIVAVDNNGLLSWTASGGAGSVNSGTINRLTYYAATGTVVSELAAITASRALVSNASGLPVASTTTTTQVQYLSSATGTTGTASTNLVFSTSPTLVTPVLGTPTSVTLTNATGLPLSTGVTGVLPVANGGTNASSASITAFNNITGYIASGATGTTTTNLVFSTNAVLTTPTLGVATATTINGNTFTTGTYTLTGGTGKTLTFNNTITLTGTDATTMTFPSTSATLARTDAANTFTGNQIISGTLTINGNTDFGNNLITKYGVTTTSQSGTTYTLLSTDNGTVVSFTSGSAVTVTLPAGLPTGFNCSIRQLGAGQVSISVSGTTMHNYNTETKTAGLYAVVNLIYESLNTYTLAGETGP